MGVFTAFLLGFSKTLFYSYINRLDRGDFIARFFYTKLGFRINKFSFLPEYEKIRVFDLLTGLVCCNFKTLDCVRLTEKERLVGVKREVYLNVNIFSRDSINAF